MSVTVVEKEGADMVDQGMVNGVNVSRLFSTLEAIKRSPNLARFNFRARNRWINGGRNRTTVQDFYGGEDVASRPRPFVMDADAPQFMLGDDQSANPVEYVLAALAGCLTTSLIYNAAVQGIKIDEVESTLEGDLDLHGFLGLKEDIRNGYENVRITFSIKADASEEKLKELCRLAQKRSPVFDIISNPVLVEVGVEKM